MNNYRYLVYFLPVCTCVIFRRETFIEKVPLYLCKIVFKICRLHPLILTCHTQKKVTHPSCLFGRWIFRKTFHKNYVHAYRERSMSVPSLPSIIRPLILRTPCVYNLLPVSVRVETSAIYTAVHDGRHLMHTQSVSLYMHCFCGDVNNSRRVT